MIANDTGIEACLEGSPTSQVLRHNELADERDIDGDRVNREGNPVTWLTDVLERIPTCPPERLIDLLPDRWKAARGASKAPSDEARPAREWETGDTDPTDGAPDPSDLAPESTAPG